MLEKTTKTFTLYKEKSSISYLYNFLSLQIHFNI